MDSACSRAGSSPFLLGALDTAELLVTVLALLLLLARARLGGGQASANKTVLGLEVLHGIDAVVDQRKAGALQGARTTYNHELTCTPNVKMGRDQEHECGALVCLGIPKNPC